MKQAIYNYFIDNWVDVIVKFLGMALVCGIFWYEIRSFRTEVMEIAKTTVVEHKQKAVEGIKDFILKRRNP